MQADTHGVSPERGAERGTESWAERQKAELPCANTPRPRGQSKQAGRPPSLPCLLGTPRARSSKAGSRGSPAVPAAAISHTLCPTGRRPSEPDQQP